MQADLRDVERRNAERVTAGETTKAGVAAWMAEEFPFLEREQPWRQASLIVTGSQMADLNPATEIAVAELPGT
jgi:hypothetical protein